MIACVNMYDLRLSAAEFSAIEVLSSLLSLFILIGSLVVPIVIMTSLYIEIQNIQSLKQTDEEKFESEIKKIYESKGEII